MDQQVFEDVGEADLQDGMKLENHPFFDEFRAVTAEL